MNISLEDIRDDLPEQLNSIHNYYEVLVIEALRNRLGDRFGRHEYIADIACVALNHLPPRYIRHKLDMAFYLSPDESEEIASKVEKAVSTAIDFVEQSGRTYTAS